MTSLFVLSFIKTMQKTQLKVSEGNPQHNVDWSLHILLLLNVQFTRLKSNNSLACSPGFHVLAHMLSNSLQLLI